MNAHRPFMLTGQRSPEHFVPANDATAEETECSDDMAPGAAIVAFIALWLVENRFAIGVGIWIGCMVTTGGAWLVDNLL
jgi:hypothetical protein